MRLPADFDEMARLRNIRYLSDTLNMIVALGDRLLDGLHFEEYRSRLDAVVRGDATAEDREELLAELQHVFGREAARLQQRLEVLRYLSSEAQERLERPDLQAIALSPHELPQGEERRSLPSPSLDNWLRPTDIAAQIENGREG